MMESSEDEEDVPYVEESDDWVESSDTDEENGICELNEDEEIVIGDFVLAKFTTKTQIIYYVGRIEEVHKCFEDEVSFYRRKGNKFHLPDVVDVSTVERKDLAAKLPRPSQLGGTQRVQRYIKFPVDFNNFNIK